VGRNPALTRWERPVPAAGCNSRRNPFLD